MSILFSFCLYYISFIPLWLSILFVDMKSCAENRNNLWTEKISICCILILALICLVTLFAELRTSNKENTTLAILKQAKEEKTLTAEYLLSYIYCHYLLLILPLGMELFYF